MCKENLQKENLSKENLSKENRRRIGAQKERFVCDWLSERGYVIVERNFRCRMGEIDIVAREGGFLVFVEVKYRSSGISGMPEEAVDLKKQRAISQAALYYLHRYKYPETTPVRFDVAAVLGAGDEVALYQNAFEFWGY